MSKGRNPGYQPGNHWVICDRDGMAYRASEMRKTWDGLVVHKDNWEPRHPQDLVRSRQDRITPKGHVRPETEDRFVSVTYTDTTGDADYDIPTATHTGGL